LPSPPKEGSRLPSLSYRARAYESKPAVPTATIFPSAWIAASWAESWSPVKDVVTFPSTSKVASRLPSVVYLARANSFWKSALPTATILPSGWTATPNAMSSPDVKFVATLPSPPKVRSRSPGPANADEATIPAWINTVSVASIDLVFMLLLDRRRRERFPIRVLLPFRIDNVWGRANHYLEEIASTTAP
jgi:hypothetical protein